ncbi:MAG: hypothetical protein M1381_06605 [Deltaproteobacteria bacterium]|nr:hypothetical protein [Deltaproteobacteria bacterium]MCL5792544.1 hypothetical protein [Deltaproteobacteria bacterium]
MLKKMFFVITLFIIITASNAYAEALNNRINDLCNALLDKDISSIYTRNALKDFFTTQDSLSNFIVYSNIKMRKAGFIRPVVIDCKVKDIRIGSSNADATILIKGNGALFFKKRTTIYTRWFEEGNKWFIKTSSIVDTGK